MGRRSFGSHVRIAIAVVGLDCLADLALKHWALATAAALLAATILVSPYFSLYNSRILIVHSAGC